MRVCKAVDWLPTGQHVAFRATFDGQGNITGEVWAMNRDSTPEEIAEAVTNVLERLDGKQPQVKRPALERPATVSLLPVPFGLRRFLGLRQQVG